MAAPDFAALIKQSFTKKLTVSGEGAGRGKAAGRQLPPQPFPLQPAIRVPPRLLRLRVAPPVLQGDTTGYMRILSELSAGSLESLTRLFDCLTSCVSLLAKHPIEFKEFSHMVFGPTCAVWGVLAASSSTPAGAAFSTLFCEFVAHLVSANCCYLLPALNALVRAFRTTECVYLRDAAPVGEGEEEAAGPPQDPALYVYTALKSILRLAPAGIVTLFRVISENFPPKRASAAEHRMFVGHLLRTSDDLPPLRDRIFAIIVDKMIQLDVRVVASPPWAAVLPAPRVVCACRLHSV